jgi:hypothetical protein
MNSQTIALDPRSASAATARRFTITALFLVALFLATSAGVGAEERNLQNAFVSFCRQLGGTPKREATHVVTCSEPNGTTTTCDFNDKKSPACTTTYPPEISTGDLSPTDPEPQAPSGNVQPFETTGTSLDAQSVQGAPASTVDAQIEPLPGTLSPIDAPPAAIEGGGSVVPMAPSNGEELPVFGD